MSMNTSKRIAASLITIILMFHCVIAQEVAPVNGKPRNLAELKVRINELLDQPKFAAARIGILITTSDGKAIYERDADKSFVPASNLKLYTSAATLDAFGPDYKIKTSVYATKPIRGGILRGDLILYGRGDPNISTRFDPENPKPYSGIKPADHITAIEILADKIKESGIKTIIGNIVGDESFFAGDAFGPSWEWDDLQFYYGAEISALTVNDNSVTFKVTPTTEAKPPQITVQPLNKYLKIVNNSLTTKNGETRIGVYRPLNSNTVVFFGTIPRNALPLEVDIAVHNPAAFAADLLAEALERRGVKISARVKSLNAIERLSLPFDHSQLTEIASIESKPISELLKVVNKPSQNLHTELMLRLLGIRHPDSGKLDEYGYPKSMATLGNQVRNAFLQKAGISLTSLRLLDGSGLARQNLITPRSTVTLLQFMSRQPYFNTYKETLTIAGIDGTLEGRMLNTSAADNFRGKTGTLSNVNSLSGYVTTKNGQSIILSMMSNNYTGPGREVTSVYDQICVMLSEIDF